MKNTTISFLIVALILATASVIFAGSQNTGVTAKVIANNQENQQVQRITLTQRNSNYYPETITVKASQPVSIALDDSVKGCLRSFTIRDLGVSKYVRTSQETIDFTPNKKGTFSFSCSMGMGYGRIIIE